jgi:hypothetical protein
MKPKRIQRRRAAGWRMPEGTIYVGRPTKWGNPYKITDYSDPELCLKDYRDHIRRAALDDRLDVRLYLGELRGKDLACWCPIGSPCHADILLEMANRPLATMVLTHTGTS